MHILSTQLFATTAAVALITPLTAITPAALLLFATGLAALGLLGSRRKRKAAPLLLAAARFKQSDSSDWLEVRTLTNTHWHSRAQEARRLAQQLKDPEAKAAKLEMAVKYDPWRLTSCRDRPPSQQRQRDSIVVFNYDSMN